MRGEIHNAKQCTFDGRDCFISSIEPFDTKDGVPLQAKVSEHSTYEEAFAWLEEQALRRGELLEVDDDR